MPQWGWSLWPTIAVPDQLKGSWGSPSHCQHHTSSQEQVGGVAVPVHPVEIKSQRSRLMNMDAQAPVRQSECALLCGMVAWWSVTTVKTWSSTPAAALPLDCAELTPACRDAAPSTSWDGTMIHSPQAWGPWHHRWQWVRRHRKEIFISGQEGHTEAGNPKS